MREEARPGEDMEATKRLTCNEATRQFFAYLDRALSAEPLDALEAHLQACLDCCDKLDFSRRLDRFVKERMVDAPLPEGIEEKVRRILRG